MTGIRSYDGLTMAIHFENLCYREVSGARESPSSTVKIEFMKEGCDPCPKKLLRKLWNNRNVKISDSTCTQET
jgi:hypothetical protein